MEENLKPFTSNIEGLEKSKVDSLKIEEVILEF